jgi:hypothetical protein
MCDKKRTRGKVRTFNYEKSKLRTIEAIECILMLMIIAFLQRGVQRGTMLANFFVVRVTNY